MPHDPYKALYIAAHIAISPRELLLPIQWKSTNISTI